MTSVFRFGGKRYGESMPGKGLPDALLTFAESSKNLVGALLDCKAAADGYRMDSDHLLRFQRYVSEMRPELEERGVDVRYVVVLSSEFQGTAGARHPFHNRASSLRKSHDVQLVYLRAVDLARLAVTVSYTHLRAHETVLDLVCRLLLEKKKTKK